MFDTPTDCARLIIDRQYLSYLRLAAPTTTMVTPCKRRFTSDIMSTKKSKRLLGRIRQHVPMTKWPATLGAKLNVESCDGAEVRSCTPLGITASLPGPSVRPGGAPAAYLATKWSRRLK